MTLTSGYTETESAVGRRQGILNTTNMACPVTKEYFGKSSKGEDVYKFIFTNDNNVTISVLNFGCVVYEIKTPDKDGNVVDINLGFDNVKDYEGNQNYFGALCGRVANRIGNAKFTLDGQSYELSVNDPFGGHMVHGGFEGFARKVWSWSIKDNKLILSYVDPDGSEGLPGEVLTYVTYTLTNENMFTMDYKSTTTEATPIDMGSHFMVNLGGHGAGDIKDHVITINADKYLAMGDDFLPTGEMVEVEGTVMDFRKPKSLAGDVIENLVGGQGFHHAYCTGERGVNKLIARVDHPTSKRYMEVRSTNTTVFAYGNFFMPVIMKDRKCKDGVVYKQYAAIEFMPMGYPNSVNQPNFPSSIVRPGETYHEVASYTFGVAD